jgi:hypothetical protein
MYRLTICIALAVAALGACVNADFLLPQPAGEVIHITRLRAEPYSFTYSSGLADSARIVVQDANSWAATWTAIWGRHSPEPALPSIDFSQNMLVVAALGTRSSGGYGIFVDSAYQRADHIEVVIRKVSPGSRCIVTAALSEPVDVARLPRSSQPVRYRERSVVRNCD